jgi:regulator of replication initiation timing
MSQTTPKSAVPQIITRSNSSASTKASKEQTTPSTPLSSEEFRCAISNITKTLNETLAQCKNLCHTLNSKFNELKTSVDLLTSQLSELKSENTTLRMDITSLEQRITTLESTTNNSLPSHNIYEVPQLLQELSEREKCMCNIIVHGLQESQELLSTSRASDDIKLINNYLHPFSMSLPPNPKSFRLGRALSGKPRPLKVVFPNKELALNFISDFNTNLRSSESGITQIPIKISRDRTFVERQEIRRVYVEFDKRRKQGEQNISIRYKNGTPRIIQGSHNTGSTTNPRPRNAPPKN